MSAPRPAPTGSPALQEESFPPLSRGRVAVACVTLILAAVAAYANTFHAPFVFDDKPSILENQTLRQLWPPWTVLSPPAGGITVAGRPLLNLSFALNYALGGLNPWGYHAINLLIHAGAGLALLGWVRRTLELPALREPFRGMALPVAWVVATMWTLHPLQTEAVTYVVQRAESLVGLFFLVSFYCFARSLESRSPGRWKVASIVTCFLGVGVKEIMVTLPVLMLLYDRTFAAGSLIQAWRRRRSFYIGLATTWLALGWLVLTAGGNRGGSRGFGLGVSWWDYELTQFPVLVRYLALSLWPHPLVFEYGPYWVHRLAEVAWPMAIVMALGAATLRALWHNTAAGFLGFWFFGILAPTSLLPAASQMIVEHRLYLPLVAVVALAVALAYRLGGRTAFWALAGVTVAFGVITFQRNQVYRTEIDLWRDTVAKRPENLVGRGSLGAALAQAGRWAEAIAEDEASIRQEPNYLAFNNLGSAFIATGRIAEAVRALEESVRLNPAYADAQINLGVALDLTKRPAEALVCFATAVRLDPANPQACSNLGDALSRSGRTTEGIVHLEKALALKPDFVEARYNLAAALARASRMAEAQGQFDAALALRPASDEAYLNWCNVLLATGHAAEAMAQYVTALRRYPDSPTLHYSFGSVLANTGHLEEALAQFGEALRLRPDYPEAHNNLGNVLTLLRREDEALPHYEAALRLKPENPAAHNNLGLALARLGRIPEAVAEFAAAVQLAPDYGEARENLARARQQVQGGP